MIAIIVAAYLIGSVPFALLLARRWGAADLRLVGSGNVGAAECAHQPLLFVRDCRTRAVVEVDRDEKAHNKGG